MKYLLLILVILVLLLIINYIYRKNFKILKVPTVCLITGGVKCGKSLLSVRQAIKDFRKRHRKWWISTHVFKKEVEEPLFYTNCFITFGMYKKNKYIRKSKLDRCIVFVKEAHLYRDIRFNYKSVIYFNEASLLADNMDYNNQVRNIDLSLFNKLIGHSTRGGAIYYDTQSVLDCHYSIKRVCSTYFFIFKSINLLLFRVLYVREMINTENGVNNFDDDVEFTMRKVLIPFWNYYKYDRYEFSYLTDNCPVDNERFVKKNKLISFNPLYVERSDKRNKKEGVKNV